MKVQSKRSGGSVRAAAVLAAAVFAAAAGQASAQSIWNGAVGASWSTPGNWTGGTPTSTSAVTFAATGVTTTAGLVTSVLGANFQIAALSFTNVATGAAPNYHRIDVGTNTLTVSNASTGTMNVVAPVGSTTDTTNAAFTATGSGSVVFTVGGDLTFQRTAASAGAQYATVDFSGVPTLRLSAAGVFVGRTTGTAANGSPRSRVLLADVSTLSATGSVTVGSSVAYIPASGGAATGSLTGSAGVLLVGRDTTIRTPAFLVGAAKSSGSVLVRPGVTDGTFTLSGTTPTARTGLWGIGEWNNTTDQSTTAAFGTVDLTGVTVSALVSTLYVGHGPNSSGLGTSGATGVLTFDRGTIDATSVLLGVKRQPNAQTAATGTANIGTPNGTSSSPAARLIVGGNLTLGASEGTAASITTSSAIGSLVLHSGATVAVTGNVVDGGANNGTVLAQSSITLNPNASLSVGGTLGTTAAPIDTLAANGGTLALSTKAVGTASATITTLTTGLSTTNIAIAGGAVTPGNTYTLIKYGTLNNFNFFLPAGAVTGLGVRSTATLLNNPAGSIDLQITGDSPLWTGALDATWTTATQGAPKNWQLATALTPTDFLESDSVQFDDLATDRSVNIVATVSPLSVLVNSTGDYTFSGPGSIAGTTALTKQGTSKLTISNVNTFTGPVVVSGGTVEAASSGALGSGTAVSVAAGARLSLAAGTSIAGKSLTIQGNGVDATGALYGADGTSAWGGNVTLAAAAKIGAAAGSSLEVGGNITGGTTLTLGGPGRILLSGNNAFGTTNPGTVGSPASLTIDDGVTVDLGSAAALPAQTASTGSLWLKSGTLNLNGFNAVAGGSAANSTNRWAIGGGGTDTAATINTGTGLLTLNGSINVQSPNGVANSGADGAAALTATIAGRLDLGANASPVAAGALANVRVFTVFNAAADTDLLISATVSGTGIGLSKAGLGTLRLSAPNTFDGGVHLGTGVVLIDSDAVLGPVPATPTANLSYSGGSLRLNGSFDVNPNRSIVLTNAGGLNGTIDVQSFTSTYAGSVSNSAFGVGGLTKAGAGRLTLSGDLTYTGPTVAGAGELVVTKPLVTSSQLVAGSTSATATNVATALLAAPHSTAAGTYGYAGSFASGVVVNPGSTVKLAPADRATETPNVLRASQITLSTDPADATVYTASIDLTNNDLILTNADLATTRAMVAQWYAGGARNGFGLGSTLASAATSTTLAVFPNAVGTTGTPYFDSYDGVTGLGSSAVIVKYTYLGDTNLDGVVDGTDLATAIEGYTTGQTGWQWGDVDYSGGVTASDLATIQAVIAANLPSLGSGQGTLGTPGGAVPEPAALGLLLPAAALASRRRR